MQVGSRFRSAVYPCLNLLGRLQGRGVHVCALNRETEKLKVRTRDHKLLIKKKVHSIIIQSIQNFKNLNAHPLNGH